MRLYISPFFLIALLILALTNPTTEQYSTWIKTEIVSSEQGDPVDRLLAYALADPIVQATTKRQDYLVFSLFLTALDNSHRTYVLGIFGKFLPLPSAQARWQPGIPSPSYPHVLPAADPGTWHPEDGYVWVRQPPNGDLRVQWQSGRASEKFRHVVTASAEERWFPEDGYVWDVDPPVPNDLRVHWQVGKLSTKYAHVITAPAEGRWLPEAGFKWIIDPPAPGDFRVKPISVSDERNNLTLTENQQKAGCSIFKNELLCPGPGTGLCWAQGHDPYRDESPMAIDVGSQASDLYGQTQRCSRYPKSSQSDEDSDYRKEAEVAIDHEHKIAQPLTGYNLARRLIGIDPLNPERAFLFQRKQDR